MVFLNFSKASESVMEYFTRFYNVAAKIHSRSDIDKMHDFLSGIHRDVQEAVFHKQPTSLQMAYDLAKSAEAWISMYGKKISNAKTSAPATPTNAKPFFYPKNNHGRSPSRMTPKVNSGSTPNNSARVATPAAMNKSPNDITPKTPTNNNVAKRLDFNSLTDLNCSTTFTLLIWISPRFLPKSTKTLTSIRKTNLWRSKWLASLQSRARAIQRNTL